MIKLMALSALMLLIAMPALAVNRIENMKKMTVLITSEGFLAGGRGSGILIDSMTVLTCAHMASAVDDEFFIYTYPFGVVTKAYVLDVDMANDLLTLRLEKPVKLSVKPVFQPKIEDGDNITVVGNTAGAMKWYVTRGIITGRERAYLMTDAQVHPGNSGGPWFNDKGEIVGISDWGLRRFPEIAGGVSSKTIKDTMKRWEAQRKFWAALEKMFSGKK